MPARIFKVQYGIDMSPAEALAKYGLRKAVRIGVNRAAAIVKAAEVAESGKLGGLGYTPRSIRILVRVYPNDHYTAVIGTGRGVKFSRGRYKRGKHKGEKRLIRPSKYAWLVIRGTKHARPGFNWLQSTLDATSEPYRQKVCEEVAREIEKELARRSGG